MNERNKWHWVEWSLFWVYTSWFVLGMFVFIAQQSYFKGLSLGALLFFMCAVYAIPLLFWRPGYVNRQLFPLSILLTVGSLQLYVCYIGLQKGSILAIPLLLVGYLSSRSNLWWIVPAFLIGMPIATVVLTETDSPILHLLDDMLSSFLCFGVGLSVQRILKSNLRMKKLLEENEHQYRLIHEQNMALEQYASEIEKLTLLEERNRLARELHDTVGHTFTSVIMGMDAVAYLLEAAPAKAKDKLDVLRGVTRNGLEEVRRSIHQIAPQTDEGTLAQQLTRLANEFALHTGTRVRFAMEGAEIELPKQTQLTFIRCLQESLTNAKRHGQASAIEIKLTFTSERLQLHVLDDGIGTDRMESGFGLGAMKERLMSLQGTLTVQSARGTGTIVTSSVPLNRQHTNDAQPVYDRFAEGGSGI